MAIGDPFATTYEGARQGTGALGEGILTAAGMYAKRKEEEAEKQAKKTELIATLASKGIYPSDTGEEFKLEGLGKFKKPKQFNFQEVMDILNKNQQSDNALGITGATLDPATGETKLTFGEISEAKQKREIETATIKERNIRLNKLKELNKAVDFFEGKIEEIPGGKGLGGRFQGLGVAISGALQTNPKAAAYMANIEGLRSQIARGLGEVGNLSEYEQKYAINLLPKVTDNLETRKAKLKNFRDYIKIRGSSDMPQEIIEFATIEEANNAGLKPGTRIMINGRPAIWE